MTPWTVIELTGRLPAILRPPGPPPEDGYSVASAHTFPDADGKPLVHVASFTVPTLPRAKRMADGGIDALPDAHREHLETEAQTAARMGVALLVVIVPDDARNLAFLAHASMLDGRLRLRDGHPILDRVAVHIEEDDPAE